MVKVHIILWIVVGLISFTLLSLNLLYVLYAEVTFVFLNKIMFDPSTKNTKSTKEQLYFHCHTINMNLWCGSIVICKALLTDCEDGHVEGGVAHNSEGVRVTLQHRLSPLWL